jgi:hypothetical protein
LSHPSEKYDIVSWDDDIPNIIYGIWKNKKNVPNHQPDNVGKTMIYKPPIFGMVYITYLW